jgi:hypothetical protein
MRAFKTIFQLQPVAVDNLSLRVLLSVDTSLAGRRLSLRGVPVCCGGFFHHSKIAKEMSVRVLLGVPYRGHRRSPNSNIRVGSIAPSRIVCRCSRACSTRIEERVCQVGRKKRLSSVSEYWIRERASISATKVRAAYMRRCCYYYVSRIGTTSLHCRLNP